jgi:transcriptional regulator with XRE-family HTH domain
MLVEFCKQLQSFRRLSDDGPDTELAYIVCLVTRHELRELREKRGLSQTQLAEMVGVPQPRISELESGVIPGTRPRGGLRYGTPDESPDPPLVKHVEEVLLDVPHSEFVPARYGAYRTRRALY